ncbi:MAG: ATP F0F1 synthase subunit B [Pseudomonadota bacterium]
MSGQIIPTLMIIAEEVKDASSGGLPQMDVSTYSSQLFWLAVTFAILFWQMSSNILPRLGGIIEERKDRIADDLDRAAEFRLEAEEAQAGYEEALSEARAKAQTIAGETRNAINDEIADLQSSMEAELATKVANAEKRIADMRGSAAEKVREAATQTTRSVVETLIEEVPSNDAIEGAVAGALQT